MEFTSETLFLPATVGAMSIVGVGPTRPCSWGNYFWLGSNGPRVLNFWAENLESAAEALLTDGLVRVIKFSWQGLQRIDGTVMVTKSACIIQDDRIPADWYYNSLCFTGGGNVPVEVARQIYAILGDPTDQLEQFTDPVSYYAKRGATYRDGCISYGLKSAMASLPERDTLAMATKYVDGQVVEPMTLSDIRARVVAKQPEMDVGTFYAPYMPKAKP